jgi:hypothetical protein
MLVVMDVSAFSLMESLAGGLWGRLAGGKDFFFVRFCVFSFSFFSFFFFFCFFFSQAHLLLGPQVRGPWQLVCFDVSNHITELAQWSSFAFWWWALSPNLIFVFLDLR